MPRLGLVSATRLEIGLPNDLPCCIRHRDSCDNQASILHASNEFKKKKKKGDSQVKNNPQTWARPLDIYLFIYLFVLPALNPESYARARVWKAQRHPMLVITLSKRSPLPYVVAPSVDTYLSSRVPSSVPYVVDNSSFVTAVDTHSFPQASSSSSSSSSF